MPTASDADFKAPFGSRTRRQKPLIEGLIIEARWIAWGKAREIWDIER